MKGIYTLANDVVYDQLVALLNSIEVNVGSDFPVCVIPYDDRLDKVKSEIDKRKNVTLFDNKEVEGRWKKFAVDVWQNNQEALKTWQEKGEKGIHRLGTHFRFFGFDQESIFDEFIYCDADVLVLDTLDYIFEKLQDHDFVVYDFQHKDVSHVYNVKSPNLYNVFSQETIEKEIFFQDFTVLKKAYFLKSF